MSITGKVNRCPIYGKIPTKESMKLSIALDDTIIFGHGLMLLCLECKHPMLSMRIEILIMALILVNVDILNSQVSYIHIMPPKVLRIVGHLQLKKHLP